MSVDDAREILSLVERAAEKFDSVRCRNTRDGNTRDDLWDVVFASRNMLRDMEEPLLTAARR